MKETLGEICRRGSRTRSIERGKEMMGGEGKGMERGNKGRTTIRTTREREFGGKGEGEKNKNHRLT